MSEHMKNGSAQGLSEFCDWLIKKGLMTSAAVEPLRSAAKQIVATVDEGTEASSVQVGDPSFDVDAYMDRFEKLAGARYAPDSLNAYRRRFKRAVDLYRQYLENGAANFKAPAGRPTRRRASKETPLNGRTEDAGGNGTLHNPPPSPDLIDYPFPLRSGQIAHLHLPAKLEKDDADRMTVVIRALVFEPQRQLEKGGEPA